MALTDEPKLYRNKPDKQEMYVVDEDTLAALSSILAALSDTPQTIKGFADTVGTSYVQVPATDGEDIIEAFIDNTSAGNKSLVVSFDDGTSDDKTIQPGGHYVIPMLGSSLKHIHIKGSVAGCTYEIVLRRKLP